MAAFDQKKKVSKANVITHSIFRTRTYNEPRRYNKNEASSVRLGSEKQFHNGLSDKILSIAITRL